MHNGDVKILIVEDEKGLRLGTKRLLEREGFYVEDAENGTDGIALGTTKEFDIAILDLKIPDYDGIQVLTEILKVHPNTICYIATAYASYDTAIEATKIGAYGYITKPFTPEELLLHVEKGSERRRLLLENEKWRKEREERLLEVAFEKTRINTIINSISDGILVINRKGEAVLFNPSALKFLELHEIKIEEYIIDRVHPEIGKQMRLFLESNTFIKKSYSTQIQLESDPETYIEATSSPVPHPDGSLAGVVVVIKNISELKKMELFKSQFVSMVSHELKAPIAAVNGYLNLLSDGKIKIEDATRQKYLLRSKIRLDSLLKLVNDLLDISRMEKKAEKKERKEIALPELIAATVDFLQFEVKKKNLKIEYRTENDLPHIHADYDEVNRLFTNLLSNAIKYNKQDGEIIISLYSLNQYLVIKIKDTGIGMQEQEVKKLFREFFRAKNELTQDISGTGLGLAIVKRITDSYAAKIEVESEYTKGSVFTIYWPITNSNVEIS
jgi:two-component system, OmpR family, phosphate regulon sensor histidine kinase PhoR